jgi:hypothetical protein
MPMGFEPAEQTRLDLLHGPKDGLGFVDDDGRTRLDMGKGLEDFDGVFPDRDLLFEDFEVDAREQTTVDPDRCHRPRYRVVGLVSPRAGTSRRSRDTTSPSLAPLHTVRSSKTPEIHPDPQAKTTVHA